MEKLQLFDQNHGLSPLRKCQFCVLFKSIFILSKKGSLLRRTPGNSFSRCNLVKTKRQQNLKFVTKTMDQPLLKNANFGFLKPMFSQSRKACFLYKTSKIVFLRFIFTIYYMGIQGVTRGYRGLQGVLYSHVIDR